MTIIEKMDGTRYKLPSDINGVLSASLKVNPVDIVYNSENILGAPGRNRVSRFHGVRLLQLQLFLQAADVAHTSELRDEIARLLDGEEDFYVYESLAVKGYEFQKPGELPFTKWKDLVEYSDYMHKRWRVERINNDGIEWNGLRGKRVIEFETSQLPYAETPYTTLEFQEFSKTWDADKFYWNSGISWGEELPVYEFNSNQFIVRNLGDVKIDPTRRIPLRIELEGEFSTNTRIRNITTGDEFLYNGPLQSGEKIVIDGIQMHKNNVNIVGSTNKKLLKLKPGYNNIVVTGGTVSKITFDFRFYYL